jgi:hypothetical protein
MRSTRPKSAPASGSLLVGAFIPFLKELKRRRQPYLVLEQNPAALKPDDQFSTSHTLLALVL